MAQSASLQTQGLAKLLKKLDEQAEPSQELLSDVASHGAGFLRTTLAPKFPVTAGTVHVNLAPGKATILAQRHPAVFFERGSVYPRSKQEQADRKHRRRANVKQGALRIKARRFLAKDRAQIRNVYLPAALQKEKARREKAWAA